LRIEPIAGIGRRLVAAILLAVAVPSAPAQRSSSSLVNRKAPEIARKDLDGQSLSVARLRGKVVLLNFWATWCAPCQIEMPAFAAWQRQYAARGLVIVGISMDDDEASVREVVKDLKVDYSIAMGDAALGKRYGGVLGLPESFLIDRRGVIRAEFQGEADLNKIQASLQKLLGSH